MEFHITCIANADTSLNFRHIHPHIYGFINKEIDFWLNPGYMYPGFNQKSVSLLIKP